jgi:hypothetical protein
MPMKVQELLKDIKHPSHLGKQETPMALMFQYYQKLSQCSKLPAVMLDSHATGEYELPS